MADVVMIKIENWAKVAVLVGTAITTLIGLLVQKILINEPIPVEIFWGIALLGVFYFLLHLLTYLRFYLEKVVFLREQKTVSEIKILEVEVECRRLEHKITLAQLAKAEV